MSRFNDLVNKLCPDGVEYKTMGELGTFFGGLSGKSKEDFKNGNAKFITYMNVFRNIALNLDAVNTVKITDKEKQNTIQYGDILFTGSSETPNESGMSSVLTTHTDEKLYLNSFCFIYRFNNPNLFIPGFSKYLFRSYDIRKQIIKTASGITRFNVSKTEMAKVKIPVPPIEVQRKIVCILDSFTEYTGLLEKELELRKKQYKYYRDYFLDFGDDVEYKTLGEIFDIRNGYTPSKKKTEYWQNGTVPWFRIDDIRENGRILSDAIQHITTKGVKKSGSFPANSLIMSTAATIGEHALIKTDFVCNQQITCLSLKNEYKEKYDIMFIFYYCFKLSKYCLKNLNQSSFASVDMKSFSKFQFPLISIEEQEKIVKVLDTFTQYIDLLERKIQLSRKQYEYYRNRLLQFRIKNA